jgi:hypothetical protein
MVAIVEILPELTLAVASPVRIAVPEASLPAGSAFTLRDVERGSGFIAQRDGTGALVAVIGPTVAGEARRYQVEAVARQDSPGVRVAGGAEKQLDVSIGGKPFTTYLYDSAFARPYFYPVLGPGGRPVTRNYPMKKDVPGETHDHPHHRSLWTAYGEVNGVDDWSESQGKHGWIRHQRFAEQTSGPAFGGFVAENLWTAPDGAPLLRETRRLRFYNTGDERRLFDYEVTFAATEGDVTFGDTKEGGIISLRVATTMDGNKGGKIENASGGVTEKECWGKAAAWCDYSGSVGGAVVGIAVMDHPGNFRHPTHWHVRDYGLMGTNVFGTSSFEGGGGHRGEYVLKKGERLDFRYRVLIHEGDAHRGRVSDAYHAYIQPAAGKSV